MDKLSVQCPIDHFDPAIDILYIQSGEISETRQVMIIGESLNVVVVHHI